MNVSKAVWNGLSEKGSISLNRKGIKRIIGKKGGYCFSFFFRWIDKENPLNDESDIFFGTFSTTRFENVVNIRLAVGSIERDNRFILIIMC